MTLLKSRKLHTNIKHSSFENMIQPRSYLGKYVKVEFEIFSSQICYLTRKGSQNIRFRIRGHGLIRKLFLLYYTAHSILCMILKNATSSCVTKVECICLQEYLSFYALSFLKMSPKDQLPQLENVYVFRQSCRLIRGRSQTMFTNFANF